MNTYQSSISEAKNRAAAAGTEADQSAKQLQLAQAEIRDKENRVKKIETEGREGKEAVEKEKKEIERLRGQLEKMGWTRAGREEAEQEVGKVAEEARRARDVGYCPFLIFRPIKHVTWKHRKRIATVHRCHNSTSPTRTPRRTSIAQRCWVPWGT
jgi:hypothetical protein